MNRDVIYDSCSNDTNCNVKVHMANEKVSIYEIRMRCNCKENIPENARLLALSLKVLIFE